MAIRDAAHLSASTPDQLGIELSRLPIGHSGYITAEDYERVTGEELDEFSTEGRRLIGILAAHHNCTIVESLPIERRVYFTKSK
jgi:hypothetical protein